MVSAARAWDAVTAPQRLTDKHQHKYKLKVVRFEPIFEPMLGRHSESLVLTVAMDRLLLNCGWKTRENISMAPPSPMHCDKPSDPYVGDAV